MIRSLTLAAVLVATTPATFVAVSAAAADPDRDLGNSVHVNIATQLVNPGVDYSDAPPATTSGKRAADAMIRYQTGKLKPLLKTNGKTDIGQQGGAGDNQTVSIPLISGGPNN